ncbi:MAG: histidine--tRNA ligase, partial [Candidatus Auribacterota bacterium]|nr:histidine--tRNA ligase [Candidatus Auribacterota bacterium]
MKYRAVKGMADIFGEESRRYFALEVQARAIGERYGYEEIRTPLVEPTELFVRSIGETTDIVEKEMFSFPGPKNKSLSLRPEGTAGVVRAYLQHSVYAQNKISRYYYLGPMFRRERPQAGRRRQFHQFGIEALGSTHPAIDVEVIAFLLEYLESTGLKEWNLGLNSVGCSRCRPGYRENLVVYLTAHREKLCDLCRRRMETNPLRVLDCKNPECRKIIAGAPKPVEDLCPRCAEHLQEVRKLLDSVAIPYEMKPFLVRGLDYYTSVVFEVSSPALGAQDAVAGGGRYDTLVEELGGPDLGAAGFSVGLERLLMGLEGREIPDPIATGASLYLVTVSPEAFRPNFVLLANMRRKGFVAL